jgi:hypothetical protein
MVLPPIRPRPPGLPPEVRSEPRSARPSAPAATPRRAEPERREWARPEVQPAPVMSGQPIPRNGSAANPSAWAGIYALTPQPVEYISTPERNVFVERGSGQAVVFHQGRAFTVLRDPHDGNWCLAMPQHDTPRGPRIRLNARGEWEIDVGARRQPSAGDASAAARPPGPADASNAAHRSLRRPEPADRVAEYLLRFPGHAPDPIAEKLGVTREQTRLIASNVEAATHAWRELQQARVQIRPSVIVERLTERERQYVLKWSRTLSPSDLAHIMVTPVEVIDSFLDKSHGAARARPLIQNTPGAALSHRAQAEWLAIADADLADGRRTPRLSISDAAAAFVEQWGGRLSKRNLAIMMTLYGAAPDAQQAPAAPAAANQPAVPQAGPSGHQQPLNDAQREQVLELNSRGMSPATIAAYVGKPRATVEAFLLERPR